MSGARELPTDIGARGTAKIEGIGQLRYSVDIIQKPLDIEFTHIEDLFRGKSYLTRNPKIFEIKVVDKKMDTRLFGAINDRARAAARNGMMEALKEYVLPSTPMNPEFNYDTYDIPGDLQEDPNFLEAKHDYMPRAEQLYGRQSHYADYVAESQAVYFYANQIVDLNSYFELSAGQGSFLMRGHAGRYRDMDDFSSRTIPNVYSIDGRDVGPGVAGYRISEGGTPYSGKNYRVYIYYGHDKVSAEYALKVHDTFPVGAGGLFLYKNHGHIKKAVLNHITVAFRNVKKYTAFTEEVGKSFSLAASKSRPKSKSK